MPGLDALFLGHMLAAMDRVGDLVGRVDKLSYDADWVLQDALMRELEVLGEAAGRVSPEFVKAHPEVPWREITGLRHKLIHDYFDVDLDIVWRTATVNVPAALPLVRAAAESNRE
ncbi:MAG: DUF86 domain-containing protein [Longimicrobiales bacterium]